MRDNISNIQVKKLHLEKTVLFAINHVPQVDPVTLKLFLKLIKTEGEAGFMSHEQILQKMHQLLKYIPGTCPQTMLVLIDLLDIKPPRRLALHTLGWLQTGILPHEPATLFIEMGEKADSTPDATA